MADEITDEVRRYLHQTRGPYRRLLEAIVGELQDLKDRARRYDLVYRIYTRADKQTGGDPLKSEDGIARKLRRWRLERRDGEPQYRVNDINDIIGVTIVTFFQPGVERVVKLLSQVDAFHSFVFEKVEEKNYGGYSASHVTVVGRGVGRGRLRCEIQVKALLNDGWATKTHDLTYKRRGIVDPRITDIVAEIGRMLQLVEGQSELLRSLIQSREEADIDKRKVAITGLLDTVSKMTAGDMKSPAARLFADIRQNLLHLASCVEYDPRLLDVVARLNALRTAHGESETTCKIALAVAVNRVERDIDYIATESLETWVGSVPPAQRASALSFHAQAYWILGRLNEAVETAELYAIAAAPGARVKARLDLAYYMAERFYFGIGDLSESTREKILRLASGRCGAATPDRPRMSMLDSKGAVTIMVARTVFEVTKGLKMCEQAWQWAQAAPDHAALFAGFYQLHKERANFQLAALAG